MLYFYEQPERSLLMVPTLTSFLSKYYPFVTRFRALVAYVNDNKVTTNSLCLEFNLG
jgi:hypothetical protein